MDTAIIEKGPTLETKEYEGERCDANCGAKAAWLVDFNGSELSWCNHHYNRFQAKFEGHRVVEILE